MRVLNLLGSRYFSHRIFCFILGVFVGLQMYGTFWPWKQMKERNDYFQSTSHSRYFTDFKPIFVQPNKSPDADFAHLNITANKEKVLQLLLALNYEQKLRNGDKFSLNLKNDSVVILVQVHQRIDDLDILIESLRNVRYINETLVIFSHDYFARETFELVHSIDFCPVMQLFYPYAIQFYDTRFPGDAPNDCPRDIGKTKALDSKCFNAKYPDLYGHYREGKFTQIKHHWLWKQHFLFDRVRILEEFNGTVLRLDDDYYLAEDIVQVIRTLDKVKPTACPTCLMYILGEHERIKQTPYVKETGEAIRSNYFTGIGRGMAFKRDFWDMFKSCAASFCNFDDYNWDWSLEHAASSCFKGLNILKPKAGRIFHIGTCHGFHRNVRNCDKNKVKDDVIAVLAKYRHNLYPGTFNVSPNKARTRSLLKGFGGWADPRDKELCMRFFQNATEGDHTLAEINKTISL